MSGNQQLAIISSDIIATKSEFQAVLADQNINFEREAEFAMQILEKNSYALGIAMSNRSSVVAAVKNIAAIGISLNPAKRQAYLVPRDGAICLDISYMGLMDLAISTGSIRWAHAELVREADEFALQGYDAPPIHKFNPFKSKERGEIIGVYVVVKTADGDYLTHAMPIDEVYAIRDRSAAWKAYIKDSKKKNPWLTDPGEMIKKTCVKQAYKYWPKTERLDTAIHHLNTDGGEGLAEIEVTPTEAQKPAEKPALRAKGFAAALEAIKAGEYDVQSLRDNYTLTDEQEAELDALGEGTA